MTERYFSIKDTILLTAFNTPSYPIYQLRSVLGIKNKQRSIISNNLSELEAKDLIIRNSNGRGASFSLNSKGRAYVEGLVAQVQGLIAPPDSKPQKEDSPLNKMKVLK